MEELRKLASATIAIDNIVELVDKISLLDIESLAPGKKLKEEKVLLMKNLGSQ